MTGLRVAGVARPVSSLGEASVGALDLGPSEDSVSVDFLGIGASLGEDDLTTPRELHTESHDPAVPEAYAAFMRTGWGDRELDLPRRPVADRAAVRRERLAGMFAGPPPRT